MAWGVRWRVPFDSMDGRVFCVEIFDEYYVGSATVLRGSAVPFVTNEDDSTDVFQGVRGSTGTLSVVTEGMELLQELLPKKNTSRFVRLCRGSWNGGDWVTQSVHWQGFMVAQVYTQSWDGHVRTLTFPLQSVLKVLQDVQLYESVSNRFGRLSGVVTNAIAELFGSDSAPYDTVHYISDSASPVTDWGLLYLRWNVFFQRETVVNEGSVSSDVYGGSYYDAIDAVCSLLGCCAREVGRTLYFVQYDKSDSYQLKKYRLSWRDFVTLGSGGSVQWLEFGGLLEYDLLENAVFKGTDNTVSYLRGGKAVKVSLDLNGGLPLSITLPAVKEDDSAVISVEELGVASGVVRVQPHAGVSSDTERFVYSKSVTRGLQPGGSNQYERTGAGSYAECVDNSVLRRPLFYPQYSKNDPIVTGAFPCRWVHIKEATDSVLLKSGLFLNQKCYRRVDGQWNDTFYECYTINSGLSYKLQKGYIRIDFSVKNFWSNHILDQPATQATWLSFLGPYATAYWGEHLETVLTCVLRIGNRYWNGSEWTSEQSLFTIDVTDETIATNKTADMGVEGTTGWYVPVEGVQEGVVSFSFYDGAFFRTENMVNGVDGHSRIITDLEVSFVRPAASDRVSDRTENVYRQGLPDSGFSGVKDKSLTVGTFNNNKHSEVFVTDSQGNYVENLLYTGSGGASVRERPESHLLGRMARHYGVRRESLKGVVEGISFDALGMVFTYEGRRYMVVDSEHDWRDDRSVATFLEVHNG